MSRPWPPGRPECPECRGSGKVCYNPNMGDSAEWVPCPKCHPAPPARYQLYEVSWEVKVSGFDEDRVELRTLSLTAYAKNASDAVAIVQEALRQTISNYTDPPDFQR